MPAKVTARTRSKDMAYRVGTGLHRIAFSATKGRLFGHALGMPVVRLDTIGRRSGRPRSTILTAPIAEPDRLVVVASFGGDDRHPAWYLNLRANPRVQLTRAGFVSTMTARTASASERAALWPQIVEQAPNYAGYQHKTDREIPLVILTPVR